MSRLKNLSGGVKFFLLICILYLAISLFNQNLFFAALFNFWEMLQKILPILFVVFLINIGINIFFTKNRTEKYFGKDSGLMAWVYAIISGILISGPPYILYPMLGDLKKRGMKDEIIAVFLYNRNVKIPFLPVLVFYFGFKYTILLSVLIIIFSIFNGMLLQFFMKIKRA